MAKIINFQAKEKTAKILLQELMAEETIEKCIIMTWGKEDDAYLIHAGMTPERLCWAAQYLIKKAMNEEES